MAFGLGVLRQSSSEFWAKTPRELQHALDGVHGVAAKGPTRNMLAGLMAAFPDHKGAAR